MSYEGFEQHICENGHLFEIGCSFSMEDEEVFCPHCQKESVWYNMVDDTNCDRMGVITPEEFNKLLISPEKFETCSLNHRHLISAATYKIPQKNDLKHFFWDGSKYVEISPYP